MNDTEIIEQAQKQAETYSDSSSPVVIKGNGHTPAARQYEILEASDYISPDDAKLRVQKMISDARDPRYPLTDRSSPLHKHYLEQWKQLHEVTSEARIDPIEKICSDALQERAEKEADIRDKAQEKLDKLVALGYGGETNLPDKVTDADYIGLNLQLTRETNKGAFVDFMESALFRCNSALLSAENLVAYDDFKRGARDAGATEEKITRLIKEVYKQLKKRGL